MTLEETPFMWPPNCVTYFKGTQNACCFFLFTPKQCFLLNSVGLIRIQQGGYPFGRRVTGWGSWGLREGGLAIWCWSCSGYWAGACQCGNSSSCTGPLFTLHNICYTSIKSPSQAKQNKTLPPGRQKNTFLYMHSLQRATFRKHSTVVSHVQHKSRQRTRPSESKLDPWTEPFCSFHQSFPKTFSSLAGSSHASYNSEVYFKKLHIHSNVAEMQWVECSAVLNSEENFI